VVTGVRIERTAPGKSFTTYNFAVADTHTYFVGKHGVWVHNLGDNPCKLLAAGYLDDIARGATREQALANMGKTADEMLASKKLASQAARDKHLADAIEELKFSKDTPIPGRKPSSKPVKASANDYRHPKPDTLYESNGYFYQTDSQGRLAEVSGDLRLSKAERNPHQQKLVGNSSGVAGDEGGHMIGTQFDGLGDGPLHMVPQGMKLNRGAGSKWRAMEETWAAALRKGDKVKVKIEIDWPPGAKRPSGFVVDYDITDAATGAVKSKIEKFVNP